MPAPGPIPCAPLPRVGKIALQIADDQPVFRAGLKMLVKNQPDMELVGEAANSAGAVAMARLCQPNVVLLGINLPEGDGISAIEPILKAAPYSRILVLSIDDHPAHLWRALSSGAAGYLTRRVADKELMIAIRAVASGQTYARVSSIEPCGAKELLDPPLNSLSRREQDIMMFLALGCTNKEIACRLNLSVKSVETYRFRVSRKLRATGRADLVRYAIDAGLLVAGPALLSHSSFGGAAEVRAAPGAKKIAGPGKVRLILTDPD